MAFLGPRSSRRKANGRQAVRVAAAVLVSILLNVGLFSLAARMGAFAPPGRREVKPVALAPLSAQQWDANRAIAGAAPPAARPQAQPPAPKPPAPKPPPPPAPEPREHGQVVDVAPSKDARRPKDARFLAEGDNTVERESVSRDTGARKFENTLPAPSNGGSDRRRVAAGEGGRDTASAPGREGPKAGTEAPRVERPRADERLALAPRPDAPQGDLARPQPDRARPPAPDAPAGAPGARGEGEGGARRSGELDSRLLPDAESLARIAGGPTQRVDGVEEGDVTALNTRGFKYATFINRVGMAIYREWNPNEAYVARDPDGSMYPPRDRTTAVQIVLDPAGALRFVKVLDSSGLEFLDQEVVRAARAAAPFPNPPAGLADADGQIRLTLLYTLEMRRASRVRVVLPPSQRAYPE
jgi:TonB family protein